jgi:hypothetical protein
MYLTAKRLQRAPPVDLPAGQVVGDEVSSEDLAQRLVKRLAVFDHQRAYIAAVQVLLVGHLHAHPGSKRASDVVPAGYFAAAGSGTHTVIALGWMETFIRLVRLRAPPSSS